MRKEGGACLKKEVISIVATAIITLALLISAGPALAHGLTLEAVEEAGGLRLVLSGNGKLFDFKNMYPGDTRQATLTIKNSCSRPCRFDLQVKKDQGSGLPSLLGQLELIAADNDAVFYQGSFDRLGPINLGSYASGDSHDLSLEVHLPEETGNDYQGLSAGVKFIFTVKASGNGDNGDNGGNGGNGGGGGGGGGKPRPKPKPLEDIEVPPEESPVGSPEIPAGLKAQPSVEPPQVGMPPEPMPIGVSPVMPKTGQEASYPYYLLGGMALLAGTRLACGRKRWWNGNWPQSHYGKDARTIGFLKKRTAHRIIEARRRISRAKFSRLLAFLKPYLTRTEGE